MAFARYNEPEIDVTHNDKFFPGFIVRLEHAAPTKSSLFASIQYRYLTGTYDYSGYLQDNFGRRWTYHDSGMPKSKQDAEILIGGYIKSGDADIHYKLIGGLRYENMTDNGYTVNRAFYQRTRDSYFGVIGAGIRGDFASYRYLEFMIKAKPLISSNHHSRLSDLGGIFANSGTIKQKQPGGFGAEISLEYVYEMLWFNPYISFTKIESTKWTDFNAGALRGRIQEPANTMTEFGINLGVRF